MEFQDKSLNCVDCGSEFIWTAGEQLFFADKQFKNEPKRCKACKAKRANRASAGPMASSRVETQTKLLGMRQGHYRALPSNAGSTGLLQGVLPATEVCRRRRLVHRPPHRLSSRKIGGQAQVWPSPYPHAPVAACVLESRLYTGKTGT